MKVNYFKYLWLFLILSCSKKNIDNQLENSILFNRMNFELDEYYINSIFDGDYKSHEYLNIKNDTVFLYTKIYGIDRIWIIGTLSEDNLKTTSMFSEFPNTLSNTWLKSERKTIDTINGEKIYNFDIELGSIYDGIINRKMMFSRERGIINIIKNDTLILPPFL